jgi:hypothetical protein
MLTCTKHKDYKVSKFSQGSELCLCRQFQRLFSGQGKAGALGLTALGLTALAALTVASST